MQDHWPTILVVDGDPFARALVKGVARNVSVIEASDAAQAFRVLASGEHPKLIILDIAMPGLSGQDALAAFRGEAIGYAGPVLAWSAWHDPELQAELAKANVGWLPKPVDLPRLANEIERACRL